jgi:hypothetical protein
VVTGRPGRRAAPVLRLRQLALADGVLAGLDHACRASGVSPSLRLLQRQSSPARPRLDIPGVLLVSCALFCLVYGFSNPAAHSWRTPSTYGFLAAGVVLLAASINTGTFGVAPQDAGVASATVTVGQQLGASIGTSLLNTIFAGAVASYIATHLALARLIGGLGPDLAGAGARLRHRVLVDRRHLRRRRGHRRRPAPPPAHWSGRARRPGHRAGWQRHKPRRAPPIRRDPAVPRR